MLLPDVFADGAKDEASGSPDGGTNETTPIFDRHGCRRCRHRDCRTGDRAVVTNFEMAAYGQLA
jgi:hypothetical protein